MAEFVARQPVFNQKECVLVFAFEKGNWGAVNWYATKVKLDETIMPIIYFDSLDWAHLIFKVSSAA